MNGFSISRSAGQQLLNPIRTTAAQYHVAKILDRNDIDGSELSSRSADERRQIGEYTSRHGDDGARVAADAGPEFRDIVATGALDAATTDRLIRAYDRGSIDADDIQRIARGLEDGTVSQNAIETALTRINNVEANGNSIDQVRAAEKVNSEYGPDYQDPYASETLVVEYTTQSQDRFVRVHGSDNQERAWMMREHEIDGLDSSQIQKKFSLPEEPVYVSDVDVPEGTAVRTGTVEANFGGERGATQFELQDRLDSENFNNQREIQDE